MSRLERAMERFSAALDKLEARLHRSVSNSHQDSHQDNGELESLRADQARMNHELEQLKSERRALEDVTDEVAGRLDGAIREIRSVLEP